MFELVVIVAIIVGLYVVSLKLNPYVKCRRCKNQPKIRAWTFGYAHHTCPRCKGTGQTVRFGRQLIFGAPTKAGDR